MWMGSDHAGQVMGSMAGQEMGRMAPEALVLSCLQKSMPCKQRRKGEELREKNELALYVNWASEVRPRVSEKFNLGHF